VPVIGTSLNFLGGGCYRPDAEYAALLVIGHLSVTSETVDPMKIVKRIQTMLHCHIEI
jgi:hypothetical protein